MARAEEEQKKSETSRREEGILVFWKEQRIFEKSIEKDAPQGDFVFYDGPPFANGQPHYGHILASTIKDAIPRYKTMRGFRVRRRWGWDCHGLPVENLVEKELGFKTKRDIETFGIGKFNAAAKKSIMKDVSDWKRIIPRLGRFVDMEDDYKTMDPSYTESVWWAFKELWKKDLIEKSFKAMHLCPHCGTTLSNFEVSQGYKDIQDIAVTVKLELADEPGTFLLIWTTTPWTLPGNMAAAVHPSLEYMLIKSGEEKYYVAKERAALLGDAGTVLAEMPGADLIGKRYKPPFPYYLEKDFPDKENAWKVYGAEYVTADSGTGIVHIAPAFGEEDLFLARRERIPIVHHVDGAGRFVAEVADFAGLPVKPKENHQSTDIEVLKHLARSNLLFAKEKITHSYPHCWRCDTPLLNYASTSWFVRVPDIKDDLVSENKRITWVPRSVGEYRFGNWLENAREWAISRSRFWGAPLPVWEAEDGSRLVVGSREELASYGTPSRNHYFVMRHGEVESNVKEYMTADQNAKDPMTEKGKEAARATAEKLKKEKINLIIASPLSRTRDTAEIIREVVGLPEDALIIDERMREISFGQYEGKPVKSWYDFFKPTSTFDLAWPGGESHRDVWKRVSDLAREVENTYADKTILFVGHDSSAWLLSAAMQGKSERELMRDIHDTFLQPGEAREVAFLPLPRNEAFEVDYHRPYIDEVVLVDDVGREYRRVSEVFDCWFESGAMPFAQDHYPAKKKHFDPDPGWFKQARGFPADFIAEGLDQTRGWFYSLLVLSTALFGEAPYEHVIVNGLVLAEDGQKMSKRLKNYPDPMDVVDAYGADALRYYLLSSPVVRAEDLWFSERGVQEVASKNISRLANVLAFYELYANGVTRSAASLHVLDRWILSRLSETVRESALGYENYELDRAARPLAAFIDDLSVWYLRRSRDRFKDEGEDKGAALRTFRHVLYVFSRAMAPVMPFFAEHVFKVVREENDPESVHLAAWPDEQELISDRSVLGPMAEARDIVSRALEVRSAAGIKVRQPLSRLTVRAGLPQEFLDLIRDEVNVKEVIVKKDADQEVELDTTITADLKEEGFIRDLVRAIQDVRKEAGLNPRDEASLAIGADGPVRVLIGKHEQHLKNATKMSAIVLSDVHDDAGHIGEFRISLKLRAGK